MYSSNKDEYFEESVNYILDSTILKIREVANDFKKRAVIYNSNVLNDNALWYYKGALSERLASVINLIDLIQDAQVVNELYLKYNGYANEASYLFWGYLGGKTC